VSFFKDKKEAKDKKEEDFACSVIEESQEKADSQAADAYAVSPVQIEWILDSGCGRHLTGNSTLLGETTEEAGTQLVLPDGTRSRSLRKGTIEMAIQVGTEARHIKVEGVEYVPGFKRKLLSYVALEKKGVRLIYEGAKRYLCSNYGTKMAEVLTKGDVSVVTGELSGTLANAQLVCSVVELRTCFRCDPLR
jgi:hypothetical protein